MIFDDLLQLLHLRIDSRVVQLARISRRMAYERWIGSQIEATEVAFIVESNNYTLQASVLANEKSTSTILIITMALNFSWYHRLRIGWLFTKTENSEDICSSMHAFS